MAFWFKPGGSQAARAPAPLAGQMTLAVSGSAPVGVAMFSDHARLLPPPETAATIAMGNSAIPSPGWAQLDGGRFSV
jgi:hypothetical protein